VSCPSGVCNTCVGVEDLCEVWLLVLDELLQLCHLANLLISKDLILLVAVDCEASRVVPAVLEPGKTVDESVNYVAAVLLDEIINVSEDSTVADGQ
jgi:hypothetical protein